MLTPRTLSALAASVTARFGSVQQASTSGPRRTGRRADTDFRPQPLLRSQGQFDRRGSITRSKPPYQPRKI